MSLDRYRRPRMIVMPPDATAHDAARAMADHGVCSVLIAEGDDIIGILTDRDLVLELVAAALDPFSTSVADIMSRDVATLDVGASLADVVRTMRQRSCRRIPLTEDGQPVGLVTLDDLLVDGEISQGTRLIVAAQLDAEARRVRGLRRDRASGVRSTIDEAARELAYRRSA
ncbi:MAG: CBS domain-containing protein [Polyangiaceae bacterium]|nr:CBS domain-containing protein [Polyangiaceae bacterium]